MKSTLIVIIIAFSGLLIATNPTIDKYEQFVHQRFIQETAKEGELSQALGTLFGGVASHFLISKMLQLGVANVPAEAQW